MDDLETKYLSASGRSVNDCAFLAQRFCEEYDAGTGEMWVMRTAPAKPKGAKVWLHHPTDARYSGLWKSLAGPVYVTDSSHRCVRTTASLEQDAAWTGTSLGMSPYGIWGIDDTCVITWGCAQSNEEMVFPMVRFDGKTWATMPDPGFEVFAIHGLAPDNLMAVGAIGQAASFDGKKWKSIETPVSQTLTSVCMAPGGACYATSEWGALLEKKKKGFEVVAVAEGDGFNALEAVAWWQDQLWLAGNSLGLLRRVKRTSELEVVKAKIEALELDARDELVVTTSEAIYGSRDGVKWTNSARDSLLDTYADRPLHFYKEAG